MAISIGNKIELVSLKEVIQNVKEKHVFVSRICDIMPKNQLQIAMPIYEGKIVPLSIDEKYTACFYTDGGLLQCNVVITSRYKKDNLFFLEVLMLSELSKVQRREFYRYKCSINALIRVISDNEYETGIPDNTSVPERELDWDSAKILDISGGGVKLIQKKHLEKNEIVKVNFMVSVLDEPFLFNLFARILSSFQINGRNDVYEQRLEFMKISPDDRDKIIRFIFESERLARAKNTGLI